VTRSEGTIAVIVLVQHCVVVFHFLALAHRWGLPIVCHSCLRSMWMSVMCGVRSQRSRGCCRHRRRPAAAPTAPSAACTAACRAWRGLMMCGNEARGGRGRRMVAVEWWFEGIDAVVLLIQIQKQRPAVFACVGLPKRSYCMQPYRALTRRCSARGS
jgi:hypothetical protein